MVSRNTPTVMHVVHSLEGGGTERVLCDLLRSFDRRKTRHAVVTLRQAGSLVTQLPDEVACCALGLEGRCRGAGLALASVIRSIRPAILHARNVCTWADSVVAAALVPQTRLVLGFHGLQDGGAFPRRMRMIARLARLTSDVRFTSVSHEGRDALCTQLSVPQSRVTVLGNGVDLERYTAVSPSRRMAIRQAQGWNDGDFVIGTVGSLTAVKGHDVLLEAFAQVWRSQSHFRLMIVGDGPLDAQLRAKAVQLGIEQRATFAGRRGDVSEVLQGLDAYACSSQSEGVSNALLEAMASGLPVVTTAVGDHAMIVRGGIDGLIVPPNNSTRLAEAISMLCNDPDRAAILGRAARSRVENMGFCRVVAAYEDFYASLIARPEAEANPVARLCLSVSKSVIGAGSARTAEVASLQ